MYYPDAASPGVPYLNTDTIIQASIHVRNLSPSPHTLASAEWSLLSLPLFI